MITDYVKPASARLETMKVAFVTMALLLAAAPATAELGGDVSTVQADQAKLSGVRKVTTTTAYSMHEIVAATGTRVREFVSPAGTVFAVAWQGTPPDLHQLLGTYFDRYAQAIQNSRVRRAPLSLHQADLVVEAGGHMRSFSGRAYLPQMMPQGIDAKAIQ